MEPNEYIQIKGDTIEISLNWRDFDGDDCFNDFHIIVTSDQIRRFDFGPCAVRGLRNVTMFFKDPTINTVDGGFRNPDIRRYHFSRLNGNYQLAVTFEGSGLLENFEVLNPTLSLKSNFLNAYDGVDED